MHRCISVFIFMVLLADFIKQTKSGCKRFEQLSVIINRPGPNFVLPLKLSEAHYNGWEYVTTDEKYNLDIYRYQHYDIFYTLFYQDELVGVAPVYDSRIKMTVAGFKESVREQGLPSAMSAWAKPKMPSVWRKVVERGRGWSAMFHKKLVFIDKMEKTIVRYGMILFVDPEVIKQGLTAPCTQNQVYFKGSSSSWYQVPDQVSDIPTQLPQLIKHGCYDTRGNYYFYNLHMDTSWRTFHGFFALYDNEGLLSGFGVMLVGVMNESGERWLYPNRHIHSAFPIYTEVLIPVRHEIILNENSSFNDKCTTEGLTALHIMTTPRHIDFKCVKK